MSKSGGFTAIELLITLFVAAAFVIAGYQLFNVIIADGGDTRAESQASNIAYGYLREYSANLSNPCAPSTPFDSAITADSLSDVWATVTVSCPKSNTTSLSRVEVVVKYNNPQKSVRYATYVDVSRGQ